MTLPKHYSLNENLNNVVGNLAQTDIVAKRVALVHQRKIIISELQELIQGLEQNKTILIRDGIGDVIVTTDGMFHRLSLKHLYPSAEDLIKSAEALYQVFEFESRQPARITVSQVLQQSMQTFLAFDFSEIEDEDMYALLVPHLLNLLVYSYICALLVGADVDKDQDLIYASNMSKFDLTEELALQGVRAYSDLGIEVVVEPVTTDGVTYYILKSAKEQLDQNMRSIPRGKFLKSINFKEPDFLAP